MTPKKEDYLKAIYTLGGQKTMVSNKQISEVLQIAPASVTEMLGKMNREALIHYEPYKGSRLTDKGKQAAISLVRGHQLWEVFLSKHLGYSWSDAHEDAELLEHVMPERLMNRLDRFLNYPEYCPHGNAIPKADGQSDSVPLQTLNLLPVGEPSCIRRVTEEKELLDYLQEAGITIGSHIYITEAAAFEGPVTLQLEEKRVQISYKAACHIYVDKTDRS